MRTSRLCVDNSCCCYLVKYNRPSTEAAKLTDTIYSINCAKTPPVCDSFNPDAGRIVPKSISTVACVKKTDSRFPPLRRFHAASRPGVLTNIDTASVFLAEDDQRICQSAVQTSVYVQASWQFSISCYYGLLGRYIHWPELCKKSYK